MVTAALRRFSAPELSQNGHKGSIEDRYEQYQNGYGKDRKDTTRTPADLIKKHRRRQQKPDEHGTAVAHKDGRRVEVEYQETHESSDQRARKQQLVCKPVGREI